MILTRNNKDLKQDNSAEDKNMIQSELEKCLVRIDRIWVGDQSRNERIRGVKDDFQVSVLCYIVASLADITTGKETRFKVDVVLELDAP